MTKLDELMDALAEYDMAKAHFKQMRGEYRLYGAPDKMANNPELGEKCNELLLNALKTLVKAESRVLMLKGFLT